MSLDAVILSVIVLQFLYIIWITSVLHNMIQGLYSKDDEECTLYREPFSGDFGEPIGQVVYVEEDENGLTAEIKLNRKV